MAIFDGLRYGQPVYPLYSPDEYKFTAPKGLLTYATLAGKDETTSAKAGSKSGTDKGFPAIPKQLEYVTGQKDLYDRTMTGLTNKLLEGFNKHGGLDYIKTDEGSKIASTIQALSQQSTSIKNNQQLATQTYKQWEQTTKTVANTNKSGTQYAIDNVTGAVKGVKYDADGNPSFVSGKDVEELVSLGASPLTVNEYNDLLYQHYNLNAEGKIGKPEFATGYDNSKSWVTQMNQIVTEAQQTSSGVDLGLSIADSVPTELGIAGKYIYQYGDLSSNVRALLAATGEKLDDALTGDERVSAYQSYNEDLMRGDADAWKYELTESKTDKTKKDFVYNADGTPKREKYTFKQWLDNKIVSKASGLEQYTPDTKYMEVSLPTGGSGSGTISAGSTNYYNVLGASATAKNPYTGQTLLNWNYSTVDANVLAKDLAKMPTVSAVGLANTIEKYQTLAQTALIAAGKTAPTQAEINAKAWDLAPEDIKTNLYKQLAITTKENKQESGTLGKIVNMIYPGLSIDNKTTIADTPSSLFLGPDAVMKYGTTMAEHPIPSGLAQTNSGLLLKPISDYTVYGPSQEILDIAKTNDKNPLIIGLSKQVQINDKAYTIVNVAVDNSSAALKQFKGKILDSKTGKLVNIDYTDDRLEQFVGEGQWSGLLNKSNATISEEDAKALITNGWSITDDFYVLPVMIPGDWTKAAGITKTPSGLSFSFDKYLLSQMATDQSNYVSAKTE